MQLRSAYRLGAAMPLILLSACGGSSAPVASTPPPPVGAPPPVPAPAAMPAPAPIVDYNTAEYRRSGAALQAQALAAYEAGATGKGVLVGVIDSGVDTTSAEFAGRISSLSHDFAGSRGIQDEGGHGTAVSDVLLGAKNDIGIQGVAFDATLLALRTDTPGSCATPAAGSDPGGCLHNDDAIAAALDAAGSARARVVNISLGGAMPNTRLRSAIDRATAAGIIIVISAGNDGVTNPAAASNPDPLAQVATDPIAHGLVIIAGAVDSTRTLADFSNKAGSGAANYLTALGVDVRAVDNKGTSYLFSGTSFSAPTIAGAVALLAQAFPTLTPAQIVDLLFRTATDLGTAGVDTTYGQGELDLARAFQPQGQTSLGGSAIAVSLTSNAVLGTAMGDAGRTGLTTTIRDGYGRDFAVDLSPTIRHSPVTPALATALALNSRNLAASGSRASIALAVDDARPHSLLLRNEEALRARVLAGAVALSLNSRLRVGFGGGRGADGLASPSAGGDRPAFLIADHSLDRAPVAAFAVRQRVAGIGLRLTAETGDMRLWETSDLGPRGDGIRRYRYSTQSAGIDAHIGPAALTGQISRMEERATILGGRFAAALGGSGAVSWFAGASVTLTPLDRWQFAGSARRGWTQVSGNAIRSQSVLESQSLSADLSRGDLWVAGDSVAFRYSEPLRVTGGGLALRYIGGLTELSLAPSGHERDVEMAYSRPLGSGTFSVNAYRRVQPGNFASAPDDLGAAARYSFNF